MKYTTRYTNVKPKDIKTNLLVLCQVKGITLQELSRRSGVNVHTIYNWDFAYPNLQRLMDIADSIGVTIEDLLFSEKTQDAIEKEKKWYAKSQKSQKDQKKQKAGKTVKNSQ